MRTRNRGRTTARERRAIYYLMGAKAAIYEAAQEIPQNDAVRAYLNGAKTAYRISLETIRGY